MPEDGADRKSPRARAARKTGGGGARKKFLEREAPDRPGVRAPRPAGGRPRHRIDGRPAVAAHRSVWILAAFLVVSGISEIIYAFHGRVWSQILGTVFFAFLNIAAGAALFLDTQFAANWAGGLFGLAFGINGLAHIVVAVRSRPFLQWLGTLLTGIAMLAGAILLLTRTIGERDVLFGVMIGVNLILGGLSTLWLRWSARRASARATP